MILDGNSIVNRAFYGIRMLNAPDGTPTNAIFGFLNILQHLLDEQKPDALCVSFDRKEPTFRHKAYDGYKAQDLVNILRAMGGDKQLQSYSQTYGNFNLPVESFEMLAYDDPPRITLNDNPINVYCLTNCVLDEDRLENKKPLKISQYRKIDGVIVVLMTLGQLYTFER